MQKFSFRHDILPLKDKLFRLAFRITLDSVEAEDVVQDTMIKVWSRREEWERLESIEAYCLTVCRNMAIDRSRLMESQHEELTDETARGRTDEGSDPYTRLVADEQLRLVHRLIDALPEKQRTILQLRDIEGKSYQEIADIMNLSEGQVKITLFRARQKIKEQYTEIDGYGL